jgi:hypothetical protein
MMAAATLISSAIKKLATTNYTMYKDYFHDTIPLFSAQTFRRRYWMSRNLFLKIMQGVRDYDSYFLCKPDVAGKLGFTSYKKCSVAIRVIADLIDEYLRVSETTRLDSM